MSIANSPFRKNEIARRRLGTLGLTPQPGADGASLEATLPGRVRHPLGGRAIGPIRFVVEGHDHLRPIEPAAVEGLAPLPFLDLRAPEALVQLLEQRLQKRLAAAQAAMSEMRRLRLAVQIDPQRLCAVGRLELTSLGTVVVEGDEQGVRAIAIEPLRGGRGPAPMNEPVDLREHQHRIDLELQLFAPAEKALAPPVAERSPPPALAVTLGPAAAVTGEMLDGYLRPVAGEVWLMSVLVASEANGAVRYVLVDIDGKPFGEPRTISRADFDATFERAGTGGYRLLAKVLQVSESHVTWVQLDPRRVPVGKPKNGALAMFVNHFAPAAAAY